ncbi:hypothetical protein P3T65_26520 [Pseudomonas nitroreducens]|uniref:hypothetical protein n=1 Tax=Pseudomonas nitroreducens TaxID=46680 RepID=UPI0023F86EB2|nr:hypothetical protein [Pseudomonas nitroreducens]WEW97740.1 hypothetical protein P3T65_26520 [Pseudomonas nitroreducens]
MQSIQLTAQHRQDQAGNHVAEIDGLPRLGALLQPAQMRQLARQLIQIANDADQGAALNTCVDVADSRFEIPLLGWSEPLPPESPVECPHRCGSVYAKESYGAGFIKGSGMCPACDASIPAKDIVRTVHVRKLGIMGKAYDDPEAKRAYTYTDQPDNLAASKLGQANVNASLPYAGDSIDRGLLLLRKLQDQGFGVFELTPAPAQGGE